MQAFLQDFIQSAVRDCPHAVFVFDELELVPEGLLDVLRTYIDFHDAVDGVEYRHAIFIFIVNSGYEPIINITQDFYRRQVDRRKITYAMLEENILKDVFLKEGWCSSWGASLRLRRQRG